MLCYCRSVVTLIKFSIGLLAFMIYNYMHRVCICKFVLEKKQIWVTNTIQDSFLVLVLRSKHILQSYIVYFSSMEIRTNIEINL